MLYNNNTSAMLLGCLMRQPSLLFHPSFPLSKEDFRENQFHYVMYVCIRNVASSGCNDITEVEIDNFCSTKPPQYEILQDNDFMDFVTTVKELCSLENYEHYYNVVRKFSLLREMKENGLDIKEFYDELEDENEQISKLEKISIQNIISHIEVQASKLRSKYDSTYTRSEMNAGEDTAELLEAFEEKPAFGALLQSPYLSTLYQGWNRGHLLFRSAASGLGKSRMAVADLCNVSCAFMYDNEKGEYVDNLNYQGPGFFIHTEMETRREINPMFLACVSGVEYRDIINGNLTKEQKDRVIIAGDILVKSNIILVDQPDFTVSSIKQKVKELVETQGVTYGVLDYCQMNSSLGFEYKEKANMPIREDLVLKNLVTELKAMAEEFNVGILSMSQLNDSWKTANFPDEACLSGAKSMKTKLDGGSIVLPVHERQKELKKIEPFLPRTRFHKEQGLRPNMIEYIYKSRFGQYGDQKVKIWFHFDKGIFRRTDFFCTDVNDNHIKVPRSVLQEGVNL